MNKIVNGRELVVWMCLSDECDGYISVSKLLYDSRPRDLEKPVSRMVERHLTEHIAGKVVVGP